MHLSNALFLRIQKMLPSAGCDPEINIIKIGAQLLLYLKEGPWDVTQLLAFASSTLTLSIDHIILSLDWLFMIGAIRIDSEEISIHGT